jgi:hypothetical protein
MKEYHQEEKSESEAKEPVMEYVASPVVDLNDYDLEDNEHFEKVKEDLEAVFAEDRIKHAIHPIPNGYMSLETFYNLLKKKLLERYAKL